MAGVNDLDEANHCLTPLQNIGYIEVAPQMNNPDWYYCLGKNQQAAGYHLHLVKFDSYIGKTHYFPRIPERPLKQPKSTTT